MPNNEFSGLIEKIERGFSIKLPERQLHNLNVMPEITNDVFKELYRSGAMRHLVDAESNKKIYHEIFAKLQKILADCLHIDSSTITPETKLKKIIPFRKCYKILRTIGKQFVDVFPLYPNKTRFGCQLLIFSFLFFPSVTMFALGILVHSTDFIMFAGTVAMFLLAPLLTEFFFAKNFCEFQFRSLHDIIQKTIEYRLMKKEYLRIGSKIVNILYENLDVSQCHSEDWFIQSVYCEVIKNDTYTLCDFESVSS